MATSSVCWDFSDTNDELDTGDSSTYNFTTGDFSVVFWAYPDVVTGTNCVVGNDSTVGWCILLGDTGDTHLTLVKQGVGIYDTGLTVSSGAWQGFAIVCDQGTDVDGYKLASGTLSTANVAGATNTSSSALSLKIGNQGNGGSDFNGGLAHMQIWNRVLTASEVQTALWRPGSVCNGLIGYWPAYGQLDPATDLSITGADASSVGTPGTRNEACPAIATSMFTT